MKTKQDIERIDIQKWRPTQKNEQKKVPNKPKQKISKHPKKKKNTKNIKKKHAKSSKILSNK